MNIASPSEGVLASIPGHAISERILRYMKTGAGSG